MYVPRPLAGFLVLVACLALPARAQAVEIRDARVLLLEPDVTVALRTRGEIAPVVRPGWFDQRVELQHTEIRIARDAWSDEYLMQRDAGPRITVPDLEEVDYQFARPTRVRLVPVTSMQPGVRHYVIVRAEVKPLTPEDIEEVEGWLSGEAKRAGKPGPGSIARLPSYMMGVLANLSGLGDEVARFRGGTFTREDLLRSARP